MKNSEKLKNSEKFHYSHPEKPHNQRLVEIDSRKKNFRIRGEKSPSPGGKIAGLLGEEHILIPKLGQRVDRGGDMIFEGLGQGIFMGGGRKKRKGKGKGKESQVGKINMKGYLLKSYGFN